MAGGGGGHWGGGQGGQHHPREYDEYMKAYSMAATDQKPRMHLNYGGKSKREATSHVVEHLFIWNFVIFIVLMPPSALAKLSEYSLA